MTTVRAWRREEFTSSTEKHPEAPEESERYLGRAILFFARERPEIRHHLFEQRAHRKSIGRAPCGPQASATPSERPWISSARHNSTMCWPQLSQRCGQQYLWGIPCSSVTLHSSPKQLNAARRAPTARMVSNRT